MTEEAWQDCIMKNACAIQYNKMPSEKLCMLAVNKCPLSIMFIKNPSHAVCLAAVKQHGCILRCIPSHLQTKEICMIAIRNNPFELQWVVNQTESMCIEAVRNCGMACLVVKYLTKKIVEVAIQNDIRVKELIKQGIIYIRPAAINS